MSYGQYSYNGVGRLTLSDVLPYGAREGRKAGHNRATYTRADGTRCFRLIGTDVVTLSPDGVWTFSDGGFPTITTRTAWGQGFAALASGELTRACISAWGHTRRKGRKGPVQERHGLNLHKQWRSPDGATIEDPFSDSAVRRVSFFSNIRVRIGPHGFEVVAQDEGVHAWERD